MEGGESKGKTWVVLVPLPFQGHITPMLELGAALYSEGFSIIVAHTRLNSPNPSNYPNFSFVPLDVDSTNTNLFTLVLELNVDCRAPFKEFIAETMTDRLEAKDRIGCIVYDNLMYFCEDVANEMNLPSSLLRTNSAAASVVFLNFPKLHAQGLLTQKEKWLEEIVPDLQPLRFKDLPVDKHGNLEEALRLVEMVNRKPASPVIWNTFDHIEHQLLARVQQHYQVPCFAIGPLHKIAQSTSSGGLYEEDRGCISWLDRQPPKSVLYVSFGSLAFMDEKDLEEMASGLANSGQSLLWVVRPGLVSGYERIELLQEELKERVGIKGHIVKWAPQKEVLAHEAVGGFLSHCGWNSVMESISEGVPMICHPCFGDQNVNARYVTHVWGFGLELGHDLRREKVERAVRRLMVDEEGKGIRQKAMDVKEKAVDALREGGSSFNSLKELVKFIGGVDSSFC